MNEKLTSETFVGEKPVRLRGRPRLFDEAEALDQATQVFWAKGYDGATIDDLVAGTGVSRPSLYATFGDKETLFMRCLEHYTRRAILSTAQSLSAAPTVQEAIGSFLRMTVEGATCRSYPSGCLMACVVPSVEDHKVQDFAACAAAQVTQVIERRLEAAVAAGELPPDFPCAMRSRHILGMSSALALRARAGATREMLQADAADVVALLLGPVAEERDRQ